MCFVSEAGNTRLAFVMLMGCTVYRSQRHEGLSAPQQQAVV